MNDEPQSTNEANEPESSESSTATPKKTTKKKTTKKTAKKTTKKAASKKTAKKTTKKAAKKKTTKKSAPAESAQEPDDEEIPQQDQADDAQPSDESAPDSEQEPTPIAKKTRKKTAKKAGSTKPAPKPAKKTKDREPKTEMVINYVPGEECRIAMLEDGKLEELMVEPTDKVSRVGNIYVGRVVNIEPAIQAAFVDFGTEENGFLHISDLHPQYFAKGDEKTERVGKKTPRRSRPPVQDCLKKGQEIIVQVLKEGVGTKGPTLTSYLSIPGRFLVMMPGMDKVGVSRKEEDDDKRKAAKQILSQLDLPEGFGFILRTAGFDRTKAELKRDLSYLARLWKDMEARRKKGNKPRLLYTESDLLVRSIRDLLTSDVARVVIDSEPALKRVARFIKIAAPRSGAKLSHYTATKPIFHAFGIESQINAIHAREVELPSGGRLVIDQTEALVAIDVNSGRSRAARDAETNAFKTNLEAVDSICRQLRLRDMGGLVVCDMIDMRHASHRKQIEQRFHERLKRDRAKSTTAPISPFGLLEMTRQRMRGSMESQHFAECPICHGRGLVKKPDSVAASAIRDLAALLDHPKVARAELVVNPRVASSLLSTKRASLTRIELISGKALDVRVSESLPIDRVAFYAYDTNGADINIEKLKSPKGPNPEPSIVEWRDQSAPDGSWAMDPLDEVDETTVQKLAEEIARKSEQAEHVELPVEGELDENETIEAPKKKRRRRRRGRGRGGDEQEQAATDSPQESADAQANPNDKPDPDPESSDSDSDDEAPKKKRRRRRRRSRSGESAEQGSDDQSASDEQPETESESSRDQSDEDQNQNQDHGESSRRRRPRRRPLPKGQTEPDNDAQTRSEPDASDRPEPKPDPKPEPKPEPSEPGQIAEAKPKSRSRRRPKKADSANEREDAKPEPRAKSKPKPSAAKSSKPEPVADSEQAPKRRRGLYSNSRRTLSASELAKLGIE